MPASRNHPACEWDGRILCRDLNHVSNFAAYFAMATKDKKASSYAKASADKTTDLVKNEAARASVVFQLQDLGWIRKYPGLDSNQGPKD